MQASGSSSSRLSVGGKNFGVPWHGLRGVRLCVCVL